MMVDSDMIKVATPQAMTRQMASAWPFMSQTSRSSLRSSADIMSSVVVGERRGSSPPSVLPLPHKGGGRRERKSTGSPRQVVGRHLLGVVIDPADLAVGKVDDAVGHAGDDRVVRDHRRGRAQLAV